MSPGAGLQDELGLCRKFHTFLNESCVPDGNIRSVLGTRSPLSLAARPKLNSWQPCVVQRTLPAVPFTPRGGGLLILHPPHLGGSSLCAAGRGLADGSPLSKKGPRAAERFPPALPKVVALTTLASASPFSAAGRDLSGAALQPAARAARFPSLCSACAAACSFCLS